VLAEATRRGFAIASVSTHHVDANVALTLEVQGGGSLGDLALALDEIDGVLEVATAGPE
jgi:hypothetical protein